MNRRCLAVLPLSWLTWSAAVAQLPDRIGAAGNGVVVITYATRPSVCGDGYTIIVDDVESSSGSLVFSLEGISTGAWRGGGSCESGPARVYLTLRDHRVVAVRPTVGGGAGPAAARDLGTVAAADAAAFLLGVAGRGDEAIGRHAMLAAAIADSVRVAPRLAAMARDRELRPATREGALRWLARTAERDAYGAEAERVVRAIALDSTDVVSVRDRAIRATRREPAGESFLRELYGRVTESTLRDRIIRVLGESPTAATVAWLEALILNDNETVAARDRALRVLGDELSEPERVRMLYPRLRHDALKERAVRLVGAAGDAASERWLRALVEDAAEPVTARNRAIRVLAELGDYAHLRAAFARISESLLRERIITTVAEAGGAENTQFLRRVVATALEPVHLRERALRALAHSGLAATELIALYDSLPDRTLRARTINLLAERGGEAAFEKLGRIARDDPNPDLRRQAARRLAQSRDPRAQAFFERTLKN
jgi:hypothetical protein